MTTSAATTTATAGSTATTAIGAMGTAGEAAIMGSGLEGAFAQMMTQMLGGTAQTATTATGVTAVAQQTGQADIPLTQAQLQMGLQTGQLLQIQQLQPTDLQMLQGTGESLADSSETTQMTAGEELLQMAQQMQAAGDTTIPTLLTQQPATDAAQQTTTEQPSETDTTDTDAAATDSRQAATTQQLPTSEADDVSASILTTAGKLLQVLPDDAGDDGDSSSDSTQTDTPAKAEDTTSQDVLSMLAGMLWQPQTMAAVMQQQTATTGIQSSGIAAVSSGTQTVSAQTQTTAGAPVSAQAAQTSVQSTGILQMPTTSADTQQAAQDSGAASLTAQTDTVQQPTKTDSAQTTGTGMQKSDAAVQTTSQAQGQTDSTGTQSQSSGGDTQQQLFTLQSSFREAVAKTKDQLSTKDTADTQSLDADALQAQVTSNQDLALRFSTASVTDIQQPQQAQQTPTVATQIQTGVAENLQQGKAEFTIKLNPENLGEITIKMTEHEGKTTLQLFTANAETARAINNDLAALREAVRPMAVEVQQAVTQTAQSNGAGTQQGFDLGSQLAQQQQQQQQQQWTARGQSGSDYEALTQDSAEDLSTAQTLESSALDTYV